MQKKIINNQFIITQSNRFDHFGVTVNLSQIKYIISHINGHWIPTREVQIRFAEFCIPSKIFFKNGLCRRKLPSPYYKVSHQQDDRRVDFRPKLVDQVSYYRTFATLYRLYVYDPIRPYTILWRDVHFTSPTTTNDWLLAIGAFYRNPRGVGVPGSSSARLPSATWLSIGFFLRTKFP